MITSRKTQQDVRLRLDRLAYELLKREIRDAVREELEAHEGRKAQPLQQAPKYFGGVPWRRGRYTGICHTGSCGYRFDLR